MSDLFEARTGSLLSGKVAVITGAASGMGAATARLFAAHGAHVVIADYNTERAPGVAEKIGVDELTRSAGGSAVFFGRTDITSSASIREMVAKTIEKYGKIDILAAFAGRTFDGDDLSARENFDKTVESNLWGTYDTVNAVVPHMKEQGSGSIIICSSNGALNPTTPAYAYHMAKAGCESLTVNLAMELAPLGIRVNCIKPGPIKTSFWDELGSPEEIKPLLDGIAGFEVPLGRIGEAEDIAGPCLWLASALSSFITGLCLYVGGGIGYIYSHSQSFLLGKTPTGNQGEGK
ncbi:MAG: SDR family oxidoreductase [Oscillospiraceae bacterium]|jgi:NAD(P)-dependent dehydrogenase (short-subunit alcohol dehydrogenase family)|nr:SDR family oxidoreductase [Oscillospiraceae bacterium]